MDVWLYKINTYFQHKLQYFSSSYSVAVKSIFILWESSAHRIEYLYMYNADYMAMVSSDSEKSIH